VCINVVIIMKILMCNNNENINIINDNMCGSNINNNINNV